MCAGLQESELSPCGSDASERSIGSRLCRGVGLGHLDKRRAAVAGRETEKGTSEVTNTISNLFLYYTNFVRTLSRPMNLMNLTEQLSVEISIPVTLIGMK